MHTEVNYSATIPGNSLGNSVQVYLSEKKSWIHFNGDYFQENDITYYDTQSSN